MPNARHLLGRRIVRAVRLAVAVVIALTVALVLAPAIAQAREATPTAADPALEARVMAVIHNRNDAPDDGQLTFALG